MKQSSMQARAHQRGKNAKVHARRTERNAMPALVTLPRVKWRKRGVDVSRLVQPRSSGLFRFFGL